MGNFTVPGAVQQYQGYAATVAKAPSNELFVVLIGINDALITAQSNLNPDATHINETELAGASIAAIENIVSGLEKQDVSRAPIITSLAAYPTAATDVKEYLTALNSLTLAFYKKLKKTLGVHVSIGDFYSRFNTILDNPEAAGFSNGASVPCVVGTYGQPGYSLCSTDPTQQDTYLFWDHVHPTKNGHQIIAEVAYAGLAATYGVL
ncbi:hypothetical protein FRB94_001769 [Tulasnella sp. JGI-2019a]|nr:hypothetical protein FRB94_001769 [Tulasnella sp. JGI-2019a]